jgi:tRNA-Thr(GGU) m(6)t(6)A37 methyltransferase TsaA
MMQKYKLFLFSPNFFITFATMNIQPVAFFHSPLTSKFGLPRQSGLAASLPGRVVFTPAYRQEEAVRGLEAFDYLWLIWEFSANDEGRGLTVRPPRLGGNERVGVFASRSPFRPNRLGLSCVRLERVELTQREGPVIHVLGADLMEGTPIYDIKPYVPYADAHTEARGGFVDQRVWQPLEVVLPEQLAQVFTPTELQALRELLAQDPRPQYQDDAARVYGMTFAGREVRFRVAGGVVQVLG